MGDFAKDKDDLISRQAAIDLFNKLADDPWNANAYTTWSKAYSYAAEYIEELPSARQWIPCSERLPERGVSVLLSHVGYVSEDYLDIDDGAMCFWNSGIDLDEELNNLAWMPLPEPWKGVEDDND